MISNKRNLHSVLIWQQTFDIPMRTNCVPLLADLFPYSFDVDFRSFLWRPTELDVGSNLTCDVQCIHYLTVSEPTKNPTFILYRLYKKEDVVWLPMRQLSTKDKNDTDMHSYRSPYGLQQWAKPIPHSQL